MTGKSVQGPRANVKFKWKGATSNEDQIVYMKAATATMLGFDIVKTSDLPVKADVEKKNVDSEGEEKPVSGKTVVERPRRAGYRQRSFTVYFDKAQKPTGYGNTKSFKSITFPVTVSTPVMEVIKYFEGGIGKKLTVTKLRTDKGKSYSIIPT